MSVFPRSFLVFALCVPLAILLGIMLATPLDSKTMMLVGSAFLLMLMPFLLQAHGTVLIFSWNALITVFFLPGQPYFWMLAACISFFLSVLTKTLNRKAIHFASVPSITWSLLLFLVITLVTAYLTGGVGASSLGSEIFGGRRYAYIWGAILGYFAFTALKIDPAKRQKLAGFFVIGGITAAFSNLAWTLGEPFFFLFLLFPPEWGIAQAIGEQSLGGLVRIAGLGPASIALTSFILLRYGVKGMLDIKRPWPLLLFCCALGFGLFSGFRSNLIIVGLMCIFQFLNEGLHKTRYLAYITGVLLIGSIVILPMADRLPLSIQRSLTLFSFLPLDLDAAAISDAQNSIDWRLDMWRVVVADIPKYFWIGKGFAIDPTDYYFVNDAVRRGATVTWESSIVAGDYHNGPLSLIIPFGIFGVIGFCCLMYFGMKILIANRRYGEESIKNINNFLLTMFSAKLVFFTLFFGALYMDFAFFVGIIGMSIAMNGGVRNKNSMSIPEETSAPAPRPIRIRERERELQPA